MRSIKNVTVKYSRNHLFNKALLLKYDWNVIYSTVQYCTLLMSFHTRIIVVNLFIVYEICVYVLYMYSTTLHISIHYSDRKSNQSTSRRTLWLTQIADAAHSTNTTFTRKCSRTTKITEAITNPTAKTINLETLKGRRSSFAYASLGKKLWRLRI